jgi:prepilin-type N-terminal cleavage/methylation domain-containing protein
MVAYAPGLRRKRLLDAQGCSADPIQEKMERHWTSRGFTLLELILVMVILCTALAITAPSLRGWSHGARLRDSAEQFLAAARYAHTQAIAENGAYWITIQDGEQFVNVGSDFGRVFTVSEGVRMQVTAPDSPGPVEFIEFYPSGRSMPALARFSDEVASIDVECRSPAEGFRLATGQQGS